jgi:hypothetical protein
VDDVTSFGPEVVTVTRFAVGTYSYFVHNFSQTTNPGITGSPARVELTYGNQTLVFTPPTGEGTANRYWRVFNFTVNADCTVTFSTVQAWSLSEPAGSAATGTFCNTTVQPSEAELADYAVKVERARAEGATKPSFQ